jgi:hypothetical protein
MYLLMEGTLVFHRHELLSFNFFSFFIFKEICSIKLFLSSNFSLS